MVPWAVTYAAAMHARHRRGPDGRTAFERRRGKEFKVQLPPLGEQILFAAPAAGAATRWKKGVFIGLRDRSSECSTRERAPCDQCEA